MAAPQALIAHLKITGQSHESQSNKPGLRCFRYGRLYPYRARRIECLQLRYGQIWLTRPTQDKRAVTVGASYRYGIELLIRICVQAMEQIGPARAANLFAAQHACTVCRFFAMNEVVNETARTSKRWGAWVGSWVLWSLRRVAALAGAIGGAAAVLLYVYQERLLYYPQLPGVPKRPDQNPQGCRDPGEEGVEEWRDVWIQTADGVKLHSWLLLHPRGGSPRHTRPTILYFHGNAGE